jgi:hypothetical protein
MHIEGATLESLVTGIRLAIRQEVQDGAKVQMYESASRTIFTLEADGEIHILGEVKH